MKRILCMLLILVLMMSNFTVFALAEEVETVTEEQVIASEAQNAAISTSTYATKMKSFISDSRWSHGTGWGYYQEPKLSTYKSIGCCAYAADFAAYVYGSKSLAWTSSAFTKYTNINNVKTGDIIHIDGHWFVVLERSGDILYTAEGNWRDSSNENAFRYCRITTNGWKIKNGKFYNVAAKTYKSFECGYHYNFSDSSSSGTESNICYFTALPSKLSVSDTDAVIAMKLNKPKGLTATKYGANLYNTNGTKVGSVSATSSGYTNSTYIDMWWTVSTGMGIKLSPGTTYQFEFWATVDGVTYTSNKQSITTTGTAVTEKCAKGHTVVVDKAVDATCTATGLTEGKHCSVCNEVIVKQETIAAKGHSEATIAGKSATCTEDGLTEGKKCTACNTVTVKQEIIAAKGHSTVKDKAVAATCGKEGKTEGSHCSVCNTVLTAQKVVAATGKHTYSNNNDTTCNVCGYTRTIEVETTPMYRLYNPNSGEHFYTGSAQERDNLVIAGWNYEGIGWNAPIKGGDPVYRVYNPNSGDHHYTMSPEERDNLVKVGWNYEGVAWNSASSDNLPLYRLYNPNADCGSHHYTGSTVERDYLVSLGWKYEGIGWFGMVK